MYKLLPSHLNGQGCPRSHSPTSADWSIQHNILYPLLATTEVMALGESLKLGMMESVDTPYLISYSSFLFIEEGM